MAPVKSTPAFPPLRQSPSKIVRQTEVRYRVQSNEPFLFGFVKRQELSGLSRSRIRHQEANVEIARRRINAIQEALLGQVRLYGSILDSKFITKLATNSLQEGKSSGDEDNVDPVGRESSCKSFADT